MRKLVVSTVAVGIAQIIATGSVAIGGSVVVALPAVHHPAARGMVVAGAVPIQTTPGEPGVPVRR